MPLFISAMLLLDKSLLIDKDELQLVKKKDKRTVIMMIKYFNIHRTLNQGKVKQQSSNLVYLCNTHNKVRFCKPRNTLLLNFSIMLSPKYLYS